MQFKLNKCRFPMRAVKVQQTLLPLLLVLFSYASQAEVAHCEDQRGNTFFTDNSSFCFGKGKTALALKVNTEQKQTGKKKANYRVPQRQYQQAHSDWMIYLEKGLAEDDEELAGKALQKLEKNLNEIFTLLPHRPAGKLKNLKFYLMWGEDSPNGGRASGMSYMRKGEPNNYAHLDPHWHHAIVVYSAKNLMYLDAMWAKKALMHELAHAWHITNWPEKYKPIYSAYLNAKSKGLYRNIMNSKGKIVPEAYAIKNQLEYFSELSAMYFVGGDYFPYSRKELRDYDGIGFALISDTWK